MPYKKSKDCYKHIKVSRKNNMIIFIRAASVNERNDRSVTVAALIF